MIQNSCFPLIPSSCNALEKVSTCSKISFTVNLLAGMILLGGGALTLITLQGKLSGIFLHLTPIGKTGAWLMVILGGVETAVSFRFIVHLKPQIQKTPKDSTHGSVTLEDAQYSPTSKSVKLDSKQDSRMKHPFLSTITAKNIKEKISVDNGVSDLRCDGGAVNRPRGSFVLLERGSDYELLILQQGSSPQFTSTLVVTKGDFFGVWDSKTKTFVQKQDLYEVLQYWFKEREGPDKTLREMHFDTPNGPKTVKVSFDS